MEAIFTILGEGEVFRYGRACFTTLEAPITFTLNTFSQSASLMSSISPNIKVAASLTTISIPSINEAASEMEF